MIEFLTANIDFLRGGIGGILGAGLVFCLGWGLKVLLDINKAKKVPRRFLLEAGYKASSFLRRHVLLKITDVRNRAELARQMHQYDNGFGKGWDAGLDGLPMPKIDA